MASARARAPRITLLGRTYAPDKQLAAFERDWVSLPWFTYRSAFPRMSPYDITGDAGWGCMIRSAQMMLGQAFVRHYLGRDFQVDPNDPASVPPAYADILRWFIDYPSHECVYSIHNLVQRGIQYDTLPGEWFGPTSIGKSMRDVMEVHYRHMDGPMQMLVTNECVVYKDEVEALCGPPPQRQTEEERKRLDDDDVDPLLNPPPPPELGPWRSALLLLVPVRLGLDRFNADYMPGLIKCLQMPQSVGMIGGRKNHSVYFVGAQGHELFVLDPHTVQPAPVPGPSFPTPAFLRSVHCDHRLSMAPAAVDPSLAIGFYLRDRADFERFVELSQMMQREVQLPPFSVEDSPPDYAYGDGDDMAADALDAAEGGDDDDDWTFV